MRIHKIWGETLISDRTERAAGTTGCNKTWVYMLHQGQCKQVKFHLLVGVPVVESTTTRNKALLKNTEHEGPVSHAHWKGAQVCRWPTIFLQVRVIGQVFHGMLV